MAVEQCQKQQSKRDLRLGWEGQETQDPSDLPTSLRFWITYSLPTAVFEMFCTAYTVTFPEMEVTDLGEALHVVLLIKMPLFL